MENSINLLMEMDHDNFRFQVSANPYEKNTCILWLTDKKKPGPFKALGKFSAFDRKKILDFAVRYSASKSLRDEVENKKFKVKLNSISLSYFHKIEKTIPSNRESAYRNLFGLDTKIERGNLSRRMKMMAKKFHPDLGGNTFAMTLINEAYNYLLQYTQA